MFRISDLIDLPVRIIKAESNNKYFVKSVLIDAVGNKAAAILCKEGTIKKNSKIIPYENIISIDSNCIIIPGEHSIKKIPSKELNKYMLLEDIINKTIKNNAGELQGKLTDIYINLLNGQITSYEISEGYLDDFINGRKNIDINSCKDYNLSANEITTWQRLN